MTGDYFDEEHSTHHVTEEISGRKNCEDNKTSNEGFEKGTIPIRHGHERIGNVNQTSEGGIQDNDPTDLSRFPRGYDIQLPEDYKTVVHSQHSQRKFRSNKKQKCAQVAIKQLRENSVERVKNSSNGVQRAPIPREYKVKPRQVSDSRNHSKIMGISILVFCIFALQTDIRAVEAVDPFRADILDELVRYMRKQHTVCPYDGNDTNTSGRQHPGDAGQQTQSSSDTSGIAWTHIEDENFARQPSMDAEHQTPTSTETSSSPWTLTEQEHFVMQPTIDAKQQTHTSTEASSSPLVITEIENVARYPRMDAEQQTQTSADISSSPWTITEIENFFMQQSMDAEQQAQTSTETSGSPWALTVLGNFARQPTMDATQQTQTSTETSGTPFTLTELGNLVMQPTMDAEHQTQTSTETSGSPWALTVLGNFARQPTMDATQQTQTSTETSGSPWTLTVLGNFAREPKMNSEQQTQTSTETSGTPWALTETFIRQPTIDAGQQSHTSTSTSSSSRTYTEEEKSTQRLTLDTGQQTQTSIDTSGSSRSYREEEKSIQQPKLDAKTHTSTNTSGLLETITEEGKSRSDVQLRHLNSVNMAHTLIKDGPNQSHADGDMPSDGISFASAGNESKSITRLGTLQGVRRRFSNRIEGYEHLPPEAICRTAVEITTGNGINQIENVTDDIQSSQIVPCVSETISFEGTNEPTVDDEDLAEEGSGDTTHGRIRDGNGIDPIENGTDDIQSSQTVPRVSEAISLERANGPTVEDEDLGEECNRDTAHVRVQWTR